MDHRWTWMQALLLLCSPGAEMAGPRIWSWPKDIGQNRQRNAYLVISFPSHRIFWCFKLFEAVFLLTKYITLFAGVYFHF